MARRKSSEDAEDPPRRPATTPEARENELISAAIDLAEEQIRNGTASSQVITHFLKLGSTREKLEQARLEQDSELMRAKIEQMESAKRIESMYTDALNAMRSYAGQPIETLDDGED